MYIRSARDEEKIADDILKYLKDKGIKVFPAEQDENIKAVTVNFRENVPRGSGKVVSQKRALESAYQEVEKEMHPAKPHNKPGVSHHTKGESERRKEQRRRAREEKKRRYDDNEF